MGTAVAGLGSYLGSVFGRLAGELGGIFGETFSGLWKAISAGDWEGAGQVAMAGLKAAWLSGTAALQQIWNDLKAAMIEAFAGAVVAVHRMWSDLLNKISNKIIEWSTQEGAIGAAARAVLGTDLRGAEEKGRNRQRSALEFQLDEQTRQRDEALAAGDTDAVRRWNEAIDETNRKLGSADLGLGLQTDPVAEARRIINEATAASQAAVGEYWGGVAGAARDGADEAIAEAQQSAKDARERLQGIAGPTVSEGGGSSAAVDLASLLAEAKAAKKLFDAPEFNPGDFDLDTQQMPKAAVQGTFNAMAIRGLGADSISERTAKASEEVARNTKQLVKEAQQGGLVFGT